MKKRYGVLLLNVGTPNECSYWSVKSYLQQFLMDKRVFDVPFFFRFIMVNFFIAPLRAHASKKKYQEVFSDSISLLRAISDQQTNFIAKELGTDFSVLLGMRYGEPCIKSQIKYFLQKECEEIILIPLFPQYSSAAAGSALQEALSMLKDWRHMPVIKTLAPFYRENFFLDPQACLIGNCLSGQSHLIFSFHGLPKSHIKNSHQDLMCSDDNICPSQNTPSFCYRSQCYETARLIADKLNLQPQHYSVCFQSRLKGQRWIKPYLEDTLKEVRSKNFEHVVISCPSFVSDCLETIHEIGIEAKETWNRMGGKSLTLVPCLNLNEQWLIGLANKIKLLAQS
jgi:protoporphyrin/coproporphyrin ferrochelatase